MKGTIYIVGQIGNSLDANGQVAVKGVTVADVAGQIAAQPEAEGFNVFINSPGGSVDVGDEIANILKATPDCHTIAQGTCASIATKIFTAVPLENRSIEAGCLFMIHNPLFANISGNASQLKYAAELLEPLEKDLLNHYAKATGLSKDLLKPLMNAESVLTPEDCVNMGFAGKVVPSSLKAVAFFDNVNFNNSDMSENKQRVAEIISRVKALAVSIGVMDVTDPAGAGTPDPNEGRNAVALLLNTDKGELQTPYDDVMKGDPVTEVATGAAPEDGDYINEDGTVFTVLKGVIDAIKLVESSDLEAVIVAKDQEINDLKAYIDTLEANAVQSNAVITALEAKAVRSTYKPVQGAAAVFSQVGKGGQTPTGISKELLAERRAALKRP